MLRFRDDRISRLLRERAVRKAVAFILLVFFNINVFSEIVPDPASLARATRTVTGIDQLDIAAPNSKGMSYNSLLELQVSERGLILNNNTQVAVGTRIGGLVVRNRNLDNSGTANLIVAEIVGKNRTGINGYVEVAGDKADIVIANRNGININGGGFLNTDRVTLTTGKLNISDGELKSVDVSEGHIGIGERGIDALSLSDLELLSKTIDIAGVIEGSKETKVRISTGSHTYEYRTKEVKSKGGSYKGIAVDGKSAGSMYAGKIDIISNDKGAGVNTRGDLVSVDDITIASNGQITTGKVHSQKRVVYRTPKKVRIRKQIAAGDRVAVQAKKTEIDVDAEVITGYLKKSLGEEAFEAQGEVEVNGKITANGKVRIDGDVRNTGEVYATEKITVNGKEVDNSKGTIRSEGRIELNAGSTKNVDGYILSDGLTKEEVKNETPGNIQSDSPGNTGEYGVRIAGDLNNTRGVVKGREVSIGGSLSNNSEGLVKSYGKLEISGSRINNADGTLQGSIEDIKAENLINDNGVIITNKNLNIVSDISNRNGKIYVDGDVKLLGKSLDNLAGLISSTGDIDVKSKTLNNNTGNILGEGKATINSDKIDNILGKVLSNKKIEVNGKIVDNSKGEIIGFEDVKIDSSVNNTDGKIKSLASEVTVNSDKVQNIRGLIEGLVKTSVTTKSLTNKDGKIISEGYVELDTPSDYTYEGTVEGKLKTSIKADKITVNDKIDRSGILELSGSQGIVLNNDVTAKILRLQTNAEFNNNTVIKGTEYLSLEAGNVINNSKLLSDDYVYIKTNGKLLNSETGHIISKDSYLEAGNIENVRGKILSDATLTMIADTLVRNNLGEIHSGEQTYVKVANGKFENIGESEISITESMPQETRSVSFIGITRKKGKMKPAVSQIMNTEPIYTVNAQINDSNFTSNGNIIMDVKGDVINRDGGKIKADGALQIKADNVYNLSKMITSNNGKFVLIGAGGTLKGSDVYIEVSGEVVNGVLDPLSGTYRREDEVLVDNRRVVSLNPSEIKGSENTIIKAGNVKNTSLIEGKHVQIESSGKVENTAVGDIQGKIVGNQVLIEGKEGVHNIGSVIEGKNGTQVTSSEGQVINESTITSETAYRNIYSGRVRGFRLATVGTPEIWMITESIRNVGKIESENGLTYVEADKGVINVAGNLRGGGDTYIKSKNGTIEDRSVSLRDFKRDVVETRTEYREVRKDRYGITVREMSISKEEYDRRKHETKNSPYQKVKVEEVAVNTKWDIVDKTNTTSGIIGMGGNTVIESEKDIILESSNLRAKGGDIVLNAKNYLLMLSTTDDEYKTRTTTHSRGGGLRRKKTTTQTWTEDHEYANNVDLTTDGNILMNYTDNNVSGAYPRTLSANNVITVNNNGIFVQGVNFNAGGHVIGLSSGNIYIQGTKDRLNNEYTSRTRKSWLGINYGKSSDYINDRKERYIHSKLYGDAGVKYEADGKLRVEGADVQSSGNILLKGKQGLEILPGIENSSRYEEHKKTGFTASFSGGSAFVGMETRKNQAMAQSVNNVGSIINSRNGNVVLAGDYVVGNAVKIGAGKDIFIDGKTGVLIADAMNMRNIANESSVSRVGLYASADGKNLTASAGLEAVFAGEKGTITSLIPERSTVVAQNIWIKSGDGNVTLQGNYGAEENILVTAENGRIYILDSKAESNSHSKSHSFRASFGLDLNLGGIVDTAKSVRDGYKAVGTLIKDFGQLDNVIRDLVKGNSLIASLEGREEVVSAVTKVFTASGPLSGGVSLGAGLGLSYNTAEESSQYIRNITTNVRAGRDITFKSKEFETYGGVIRAENDLSIDAKTISINASKDSCDIKGNSRGLSLGKTTHGAEGYSVGLNTGKTDGEGTLYNNSHIQAGNHLKVKADTTSIRGGRLVGTHTDVETGRLIVESLQDKENMNRVGVNVNYSLQIGTTKDKNGVDVSDNRSSGNLGVSLGNLDKLWVAEQSGIIGEESINVNVRDKTTLIGGIIANITKDGKDGGNLKFSTGDLESRDLHSYDNSSNLNVNVNINQRSRNDNTELVLDRARNKDPNRKDDVKEVPNRVDEKYSVDISGHEADKFTRATIGKGTLTITSGSVLEEINRNISEADKITRTSGIKDTNFGFDSNPNSYGDLNKIISSNAGVIGKFIDDVTDNESRTNELKYRDAIYNVITSTEKKLAPINVISLIPTSQHDGGILEQVSRTFRKEKNDIVEVKFWKNGKGETEISLTDRTRLSDIENLERAFGNGITEVLTKAVSNTIGKLSDREVIKRYNDGEEITFALVHNRSRGMLSDIVESVAGKIFDGSGSSFWITTGVTKGQIEAILTRDKNRHLDFVTYSQGNIIWLGTSNKGTDVTNITVRQLGSPIANAEIKRSTEKAGGRVIGSGTNVDDIVGNNGRMFGLIGETNAITLENGKTSDRTLGQVVSSNIIILKSGLRSGNGILFMSRPVVLRSYRDTEIYYTKQIDGSWDTRNNYVLSNEDIVQIARNQEKGLLTEFSDIRNMSVADMTDYEIATSIVIRNRIEKILNNAHRRYTFTSPIYSDNMNTIITQYRDAQIDYNTAQREIRFYERQNQLDFIDLLSNGPSAWESSLNVNKAVDLLNYSRMNISYENGVYRDRELAKLTSDVNINSLVNEVKRNIEVQDITSYLDWLRKEVRWQ